jgi:hypothetical protein
MERRTLLLGAAAAVIAGAGSAFAQPHDHHDDHDHGHGDHGRGHDDWSGRRDRDWRDSRGSWHSDHDRYWRSDYGNRGYIDRDRIFGELRRRHYRRFIGDPYWYHGRYVVRTYDRWGRLVYVEVNPYTGLYIGLATF